MYSSGTNFGTLKKRHVQEGDSISLGGKNYKRHSLRTSNLTSIQVSRWTKIRVGRENGNTGIILFGLSRFLQGVLAVRFIHCYLGSLISY